MKHEVGLSFEHAIKAVMAGKQCKRARWGNTQYISLSTNINYKDVPDNVIIDSEHSVIAFVDEYGITLGWIASTSDMLANDWKIVG